MRIKRWYLTAAGFIMLLGTGCHTIYTSAVHPSLKSDKIPFSTFAVFPVTGMDYVPASSCILFSPDPEAGKKNQKKLNATIARGLPGKFPGQKMVFLAEEDSFFIEKAHELAYVLSLAEAYVSIVNKIKTSSVDSTFFTDLPADAKIGGVLGDLRNSRGADYAIVFLKPRFSGETTYSYHAPVFTGTGWSGGGGSSKTTYTADLQIQVWDCRNGQLLYESGIVTSGSNFCFFISAQDAAIQSVPNDLMKKLTKVISYVLERRNAPFAVQ
jgi:hypothetical protein